MGHKTLKDFPANMIAGCEAALDAEVFYQDEFADFVVKAMGGYGCEAVLVETVSIDLNWDDYMARKRAIVGPLTKEVAAAPRGHYGLIHYISAEGDNRYSLIASDGSGETAVGGRYDGYDTPPDGEKVLSRMVGYEIYECRSLVENERRRDANIEALRKHGFAPGMEFKNYKHPGEVKPYSKAVVQAVYADSGTLKLQLTRRGSAKRWEGTVGAKGFAEAVGACEPEIVKHPFVVVVNQGNDDLFSARQ